ncbi:MAG: Cof-type HAD-IIB family hydrolase [Oscillospiraceae bacterium]|nr:Cof-type HAD-IIB family hydrolase [Oscillospiraceae bacterium]
MAKFDGVLLVSDFDDTLIGSDLTLSQENRRAILSFMEQGGIFTVATGRSYLTFLPQLPMVPLNAPVVLSNGAVLYDFKKDKSLFTSSLPGRAVGDLAEVIRQFPKIGFEAYHGEAMYAFSPNQITFNHVRKVGISFTQCASPREMPLPLIKVIFQQRTDYLTQVQGYIKSRWPEHYEIIFSNHHLLEMTAKNSTKGALVLKLAALLGIDRSNLYCIGDNQNDIPMLELAHIGFCPSDAAPEVLRSGFRAVSSCNNHSVRDVIAILNGLYA